MIKKKKVAIFRELYDVIDKWLESYTYDDTAELLRNEHGLDLTTSTLKNYVYRHRLKLAKAEAIGNKSSENKFSSANLDKDNNSLQLPKVDEPLPVPDSTDDDRPLTPKELQDALEDMKKDVELQQHKSLINKK